MGNFNTQYFKDLLDEALASTTENKSTSSDYLSPESSEIGTPRSKILSHDPRSPTDGICRTPIEVLSLSNKRRTILVDHCSDLSGQHTLSGCSNSLNKYNLLPDSRSPPLGFTRTPIQLRDVRDSDDESLDNNEVSNTHSAATNIDETNVEETNVEESLTEEIVHSAHEVFVPDSEPTVDDNREDQSPTKPTTPPTVKTDCKSTSSVDSLEGFPRTKVWQTPKTKENVQHGTNKENNMTVKNQIFHTPENKTEGVLKRKVRTPLSTVSSTNSPLQILRAKQSNTFNKALAVRAADSPQHTRPLEY